MKMFPEQIASRNGREERKDIVKKMRCDLGGLCVRLLLRWHGFQWSPSQKN